MQLGTSLPSYFSHDLAQFEQLKVLKFALNEKPGSYEFFLVSVGGLSLVPIGVAQQPSL